MAGKSIGGIYAELSLKDKDFKKGLNSAKSDLGKFASAVGSGLAGAAATGMAAGFAAVTGSIMKAVDAGGELNDMMLRTGAAGEGLYVLQRAFENAGMSAEQVPQLLNRMQKALAGVNEEGEPTNETFEKLGLSVDDLKKLDPVAAFMSIGNAISEMSDPAMKAEAAMSLFGKSGGETLAIFNDSEAFSNAAKQVGSLGKTLSENAADLDKVGDSFGAISTKFTQMGVVLAVELMPLLLQVSDWFDNTDFAATADGIGEIVDKMAEWAGWVSKINENNPLNLYDNAARAIDRALNPELTQSDIDAARARMGAEYGYTDRAAPGAVSVQAPFTAAAQPRTSNQRKQDLKEEKEAVEAVTAAEEERVRVAKELSDATAANSKATIDYTKELERAYAEIEGEDAIKALERQEELWEIINGLTEAGVSATAAYADAVELVTAREAAREAQAQRDWENRSQPSGWQSLSGYQVNSMQSRGMSMDSYGSTSAARQVTVLERIRDILQRASTNGRLVWD